MRRLNAFPKGTVMKRVVTAGLFVALAALAAPSRAAPDDGDAPAPTVGAIHGEGAKITCQRVRQVGSLLRTRKICLTAAEWARLGEEAQRKTDGLQSSNIGGNDGCKVGQPC
ncbi:hypothetical protein ACFOMD_15380 [Sphingoaurantiacus capsulatus]|uniref:Secreted protein n=1 Tax=Sphingoaurantiacus capsulatus TaxID=1771310 RepID=A0ABV7XGX4_9SPHN